MSRLSVPVSPHPGHAASPPRRWETGGKADSPDSGAKIEFISIFIAYKKKKHVFLWSSPSCSNKYSTKHTTRESLPGQAVKFPIHKYGCVGRWELPAQPQDRGLRRGCAGLGAERTASLRAPLAAAA